MRSPTSLSAIGLLVVAGAGTCGPLPALAQLSPVLVPARECAQPALPEAAFRSADSTERARSAPQHAAEDPVVRLGDGAVMHAKFAYGSRSRDLEDEDVSLFLADAACGPWRLVGSARTDGDGRASVEIPSAQLGGVGAHPLRWVVHGDGSASEGTLYVVPANAPTVVFDVDGTLTTDDGEVFDELLLGQTGEVRAGGQDLVRRYASAGYFVVYITGRPYMLRDSTHAWLRGQGFPPGPLITTPGLRHALPSRRHVQRYKEQALTDLRMRVGVRLAFAYGNASTDVCAYARSGVAPAGTFIAGEDVPACEGFAAPVSVPGDYVAHVSALTVPPP
jgi:phosphatidate phosphatase PAH1